MDEDRRARQVTQKARAEPVTLVCALDQAGDVGEHERVVADARHAEVRHERRERIVGDAWAGRGDGGDERRFPGVREADQADVGQQSELESQLARFALLAGLGAARRLVGGCREAGVAAPAASAARDHRLGVRDREVGEQLAALGVDDAGAGRDANDA